MDELCLPGSASGIGGVTQPIGVSYVLVGLAGCNGIALSVFYRLHGMVMVGWQITHRIKRKLLCENRKHALRSRRQQRAAPALELNDVKLIDGMDTNPIEG